MAVRVGINGFGRIGRNFLRAALRQARLGRTGSRSSASTTWCPRPPTPTSSSTTRRMARWPSPVSHTDESITRRRPHLLGVLGTGSEGAAVGRPRRGRGDRVDRASSPTGSGGRPHRRRGPPGDHSAPATNVDATFVIGVNDDTFDPAQHTHRLQRLVHDQLLRADGQGARRRLRGGEGPDDHGARLHQRPEPARPGPQGPAPGPGGGRQHRAGLHGGGPGDQPGPGLHEGQAGRQRPCGSRSPTGPSPTSPACSAATSRSRRSTRRSGPRPRRPMATACSSTARSPSCRRTSSGRRRPVSSTPP